MSDVTDYLSIPLDSSRTRGLSSVYCTGNYDVNSGQKLVSLELYDYLSLFQYPWDQPNPNEHEKNVFQEQEFSPQEYKYVSEFYFVGRKDLI